jgi:metal-dependent amidase/aminoacylase/carboxypeptidase family protein
MIEEGCMEGIDEVYGLHNFPICNSDKKILINDTNMMAHICIYNINVSFHFLPQMWI